VPHQDPIPNPRQSTLKRFWRILRVLLLFAAVISAIAVILVSRGDARLHIHMMIATGAGTFLTVLVGAGLMTLVFISNSSGHDEAAARFHEENDEE
jgi:hypothetical protein